MSIGKLSIGHIVNLASNDVQRFDLVSQLSMFFMLCGLRNFFCPFAGICISAIPCNQSLARHRRHLPHLCRSWLDCLSYYWIYRLPNTSPDSTSENLRLLQVKVYDIGMHNYTVHIKNTIIWAFLAIEKIYLKVILSLL